MNEAIQFLSQSHRAIGRQIVLCPRQKRPWTLGNERLVRIIGFPRKRLAHKLMLVSEGGLINRNGRCLDKDVGRSIPLNLPARCPQFW